MALSAGNAILWSDIQSVINNINAARSRFGLGNGSVSGGGQGATAKASTIQQMFNNLYALNGRTYGTATAYVTYTAMPGAGSLIQVGPINNMNNVANNLKNYCTANYSANYSSNFSNFSNYNSNYSDYGDYGSNDSKDYSFDSDYNIDFSSFR